jgi:hypothetical protein
LHDEVHGATLGQAAQLMVAANPAAETVKSDVNTSVMQPLVAVTVPGDVVPVYVPIIGDAVFGPL